MLKTLEANMARPTKESPKKQYTIMLEPEIVERIDKIAEKCGLSRSNLMKNFLLIGLDLAFVYESFGIVAAVGMGRKLVDWFKKSKSEGKIVFDNEGEFQMVDTEKK
jgi:hypothetical protein